MTNDQQGERAILSMLLGAVADPDSIIGRIMEVEDEVLTAKDVMDLLKVRDARTFKKALERGMPGRFLATDGDVRGWRTTKSVLLRWLSGEDVPAPSAGDLE